MKRLLVTSALAMVLDSPGLKKIWFLELAVFVIFLRFFYLLSFKKSNGLCILAPRASWFCFCYTLDLEIIYFAVQMNPEGIGLKVRFSLWH